MVNTNTKTTNVVTVNPNQMPNFGSNVSSANSWCATKGLTFNQLVIGNGTNPNQPNYCTKQASSKRKTVLLNNAMVGQTVQAYYNQAKAKGFGKPYHNNPLQAIKQGLITLHLPKTCSYYVK